MLSIAFSDSMISFTFSSTSSVKLSLTLLISSKLSLSKTILLTPVVANLAYTCSPFSPTKLIFPFLSKRIFISTNKSFSGVIYCSVVPSEFIFSKTNADLLISTHVARFIDFTSARVSSSITLFLPKI